MSGVKVHALIPRRPDLTPKQFHDYYRHPHGTMGSTMSTLRRYVQSHQIDTDLLAPDQARFDAVAELWFDSKNDATGFREHPVIVNYIIEDEPKFIDMANLQFVISDEDVLYSLPKAGTGLSAADMMWSPDNRPFSVKLLHFVANGRTTPWATDADEALGREIGALRHVRCRPRKTPLTPAPLYRGVRELWWPTQTAFEDGVAAAPEAFARLLGAIDGSVLMLARAERWR